MGILKSQPVAVITDKLTGTTANAYANALDWPCYGYQNKNITLKNTHGANALKYKVLTHAYLAGNECEEVAETILAAGKIAQIILQNEYAQVKVPVKSSGTDAHATYQLDYIGDPK